MPKREIPAEKRGYLRIVDRMGKGAHSARGRDAARTDEIGVVGYWESAPELTLQGTEAVSEYSRCREEKALAEPPAGGRGPWQQQFRTQEARGQS